MAPIRRVWLLLGLNLSMAVILPPVLLGSGHGVADLLGGWAFALVYTNVTGIPAVMAGPSIVEWLARRRWPPTAAVLASTLCFVAAGCLVSQTLLMWTGVAVSWVRKRMSLVAFGSSGIGSAERKSTTSPAVDIQL